jgi:predicted ATPase/DNA-binding SARP family transcriptional activator
LASAKGVKKTMEFRMLGPIEALESGEQLALGAPKQRAVLAALLLRRNEVVTRDALVDAVWGESVPGSAVQSLQVYVHGLRRVLGADRIETRGMGYRLRVEPGELDLDRFDELVGRARSALAAESPQAAAGAIDQALALWSGAPLADLAGEPVTDASAMPLADLRVEAIELHGDVELALGHHAALVPELEAAVAEHPYREHLREQLVIALYRCGRQKEALEAQRAARETFAEELGVDPGPALRELEGAILRHEPALAAPGAAPERFGPLPVPATPLVGRRLEVAAVAALLGDGARLVTLTGPGGTGKTRLAHAVAEDVEGSLENGAVFVDLAPVSDPQLLGPTIAAAVGVQDDAELPERLRPLRLLLVLDNVEQLLPAVPLVAELLTRAPGLVVLATSRAPLRLSGEHEYRVPPLALPAPAADFEELAANDAVRLFVQRARAADPAFQLTGASAPSVAAICTQLDGLPLAIELAAARTSVLPPDAMAAGLVSALDLAAGRGRDVAPRQRTLRETLAWSHDALDPGEQALFAQLAVFAGGFSLGAAEAVAGEPVLDALGALVEMSLVRRSEPAEPRFAMLETIRQFAGELLAESGAEETVRRRHCEYFARIAEERSEELNSGGGELVLERLDRDHDNVREALGWAVRAGEVELEARLANAMVWFWQIRGHLHEGRRVFEHAVVATRGGDPRLYAQTLVRAAQLSYRQGDLGEAEAWWTEALELFRDQDDADGVGRCTAELGSVAIAKGDLDASRELYEEAIESFERLGNRLRLGTAKANLSAVASLQGDLEAAARHGTDAAALQEESGDRDGLAVSLHNLSRTWMRLDKPDRARDSLRRSLELGRSLRYVEVIAYGLESAAELAARDGDDDCALRLLAASEAAFGRLGVPIGGEEAEGAEALRARLAASRGEEALAEALDAAGREPPDRALDEALALLGGANERERQAG